MAFYLLDLLLFILNYKGAAWDEQNDFVILSQAALTF